MNYMRDVTVYRFATENLSDWGDNQTYHAERVS